MLNKRGPHPFDDKDVEALTLVANQIGIAMENARLHERLKEKFACVFNRADTLRTEAGYSP